MGLILYSKLRWQHFISTESWAYEILINSRAICLFAIHLAHLVTSGEEGLNSFGPHSILISAWETETASDSCRSAGFFPPLCEPEGGSPMSCAAHRASRQSAFPLSSCLDLERYRLLRLWSPGRKHSGLYSVADFIGGVRQTCVLTPRALSVLLTPNGRILPWFRPDLWTVWLGTRIYVCCLTSYCGYFRPLLPRYNFVFLPLLLNTEE